MWAKLSSDDTHAYRVTCKYSRTFAGWGTEPQHQQLLIARKAMETVNSTGATLEDYF